jgi:stage II sporulation protein D
VVEPNQPAYVGYFETPSGKYRGRLLVNARGGSMQIINQVQVDDWLKGVLPAEIGESHVEALKAQAVAARSEAVYKLAKPPHASEGYDFCTGVHCQAYKGMKEEDVSYVRACDETLGVVLMINGEVLDGVYSNVCGGISAAVEDVWDSPPKAGMTPILDRAQPAATPDLSSDSALARFLSDPGATTFCNAGHEGYPNYAKKYWRWEKNHTAQSLRSAAGVGRVKDVVVSERRRSGRVRKLTIIGDSGSKTITKELPIRNALDLWSGLFYVDVKKSGGYVESATFIGGGNGHGVGLCQMGARIMAAAGITYDRILAHYFTGARIQKIYRP